ncbi:DUF411 domain-containing protein [Nitratireductor aquimarinus]|uniref:DUF411 domain-containing protein n=1 Tax=Alphaproteobacteria TaxID=28211 RepID=UPI0019D34E16|nr:MULTISPECIES: DUF411 domain-containing protein [Alphaproteobacteria]MBN7755423.1 DUF411 domain-containing protein [Nitratireductor aquimarinus]MBY5998178.1 CopG family transcriptional regulator [Tritonibacter mobilis]
MKNAILKQMPAAALALSTLLGAAHAAPADSDKTITVYKTPWCGCCEVWVEAMEEAGYTMKVSDLEDLTNVKKQAGVPDAMGACHTAVIGDERKYVLEGHVPIEAVEKLMSEKPDVKGIAVPGMPMGSLGMGYDPEAEYTVYTFDGYADTQPGVFLETGKK